jgi:hypothetical protein
MNARIHARHMREDGGATYSVHYAVTTLGTVMLEICGACHHIVTTCEHSQRKWEETPEGGEALLCRLCKVDGT